jgi:LPS O-antigen subunit length determinant protein (WzzB/FepE family)
MDRTGMECREAGYEESRVSETAEKTLADIAADLWQAKAFISLGVFAGILAAAVFIFTAVPHYRAQIIVSPASPMNGADVSALLADEDMVAIRSLVQRVGVANSADFTRFENTYSGPSVAALMLKDTRIPEGVAADRNFSFSQNPETDSAEKLAAYIDKRVKLEPVGATALRRLVYMHPDRAFATYFLHRLHRTTDELIRQKLRQEAEQRIRHLQQAITETVNPEHRRNLTSLLMEQERLRMLVSIETPYAASVVEPAAAEIKAGWPATSLVFPAFMLAGAVVGFALAGLFPGRTESVSARRWFRTDSRNNNQKQQRAARPLTARDAAE